MAILREVITRFKLQTDEKDVRDFKGKVSSMKGGLKGLAAAFGITLGIGAAIGISKVGREATRAKFHLERLTNPESLKKFRDIFREIQKDMSRFGAAELMNPAEFNTAAAQWVKAYGDGEESLKSFGDMFAFAQKQAALTGKGVQEIMDALQTGIEGGGFEALLDVPGFTKNMQGMMEFISESMKTNAPGGSVDRLTNTRLLVQEMKKGNIEQDKSLSMLAKTHPELLKQDEMAKKWQETMQKLGDVLNRILLPAFENMVKLLDYTIKQLGIAEGEAGKTGANIAGVLAKRAVVGAGTAVTDTVKTAVKPIEPKTNEQRIELAKQRGQIFKDAAERDQYYQSDSYKRGENLSQFRESIVINVTQNITGTNSMDIAQKSVDGIDKQIKDARAVPRTDDR